MIKIPPVSDDFAERYYIGIEGYLKERTRDKTKLDKIKKWYLESSDGKWSFKSVVTAKPEKFLSIIETFGKTYQKEKESREIKIAEAKANTTKSEKEKMKIVELDIEYLKNLYTHFSKIDNPFFQEHINGLSLIEELDLKVCPYCNRNFITTTRVQNGENITRKRRTADLDHFNNKDEHPYLAVSLYNLIPSCKSCNQLKSKKYLEVSPYLMENNFISFDYDFTDGINDFKVSSEINEESKFGENWSSLGLEGHYESHSAYLKELIQRIRIYDDEYLDEIMSFISKMDKESVNGMMDRETLKRMLIGNIYDEDQFSQSPLSKLTRDIYDKYSH